MIAVRIRVRRRANDQIQTRNFRRGQHICMKDLTRDIRLQDVRQLFGRARVLQEYLSETAKSIPLPEIFLPPDVPRIRILSSSLSDLEFNFGGGILLPPS